MRTSDAFQRMLGRLRAVPRFLWMIVAVLVVGVPLVLLAGWCGGEQEKTHVLGTLRRDLEVHALALRGAADRYKDLPFTASRHPLIVAALHSSAQVRATNAYLEEINRHAGSVALYLMNASGKTIASSNWNTPQSFVGEPYEKRPYFIEALQGGSGSFYGVGLTTRQPGYFISAPVREIGRIVGAMAVKVDLRKIQETWKQAGRPIVLMDKQDVIFLTSVEEWLYRPTRELSAEEVAWLADHEVYGPGAELRPVAWKHAALPDGFVLHTTSSGRDRDYLAISEELPELRWTLTVTADYATVTEARKQWSLIAALIAALSVALLVAVTKVRHLRRRQFERAERQRQAEKLLHFQRRLELGAMASTLAHEIKTPLMNIGLEAASAKRCPEANTPRLRECLDGIESERNRISQALKKVTDQVRGKTRETELCDLNALIKDIEKRLADKIQECRAQIQTEFQEPLPLVLGDKLLLQQVFHNLLDNALDAIKDRAVRQVTWSTTVENGYVKVTIRDTGPGIAPEREAQLFNSFGSTKEDGMGIGLCNCRDIIERHRGAIKFTNVQEGGAQFCVLLPCK